MSNKENFNNNFIEIENPTQPPITETKTLKEKIWNKEFANNLRFTAAITPALGVYLYIGALFGAGEIQKNIQYGEAYNHNYNNFKETGDFYKLVCPKKDPRFIELKNLKTGKCEMPPFARLDEFMQDRARYIVLMSYLVTFGFFTADTLNFLFEPFKKDKSSSTQSETSESESTLSKNTKKSDFVEGLQKLKLKKKLLAPTALFAPIVSVYLYSCYLDAKNYDPGLTDRNVRTSHYTIESIPYEANQNELLKDFEEAKNTYAVTFNNGRVENMEVRVFKHGSHRFLRVRDNALLEMNCNKNTMKCGHPKFDGNTNGIQKVTINPKYQARIIPCPGADVEKAITLVHQNKLEIIALMGTGTINQVQVKYPNTLELAKKNQSGYPFIKFPPEKDPLTGEILYHQPAGEVFVRFYNGKKVYTNYPEMIKRDKETSGTNPNLGKIGYVTYFDSQRGVELLDYSRDTYLERNAKIKALTKDTKVQGFSLTGWRSKFSRNEKFTENSEMYKNSTSQNRTVFAFNQQTKKFLGVLYIPTIMFKDVQAKIEEIYPNQNAIGVIQDGDKFAGMVDPSMVTAQNINSNNITERVNVSDFKAVHCLAVAKNNPKLNLIDPALKQQADEISKWRDTEDKIADISKKINGWLGIKNPLRWMRSNQKIAK
jgi:hypothetical protein